MASADRYWTAIARHACRLNAAKAAASDAIACYVCDHLGMPLNLFDDRRDAMCLPTRWTDPLGLARGTGATYLCETKSSNMAYAGKGQYDRFLEPVDVRTKVPAPATCRDVGG